MPTLTAAQNIFLNNEMKSALGFIDDSGAERRARELFESLGVDIDPKAEVGALSAGQRQLTEIVKAISRNVTRSDPRRADDRALGRRGRETVHVPSQAQIRGRRDHLRLAPHGRDHAHRRPRNDPARRPSRRDCADERADPGQDHRAYRRAPVARLLRRQARRRASRGAPLLEARGLSGPRKPEVVDLTLYAGEVVGVAGLLGSGRSALARVLFGIDPKRAGEIRVKGAPVEIKSPYRRDRATASRSFRRIGCGRGSCSNTRSRPTPLFPSSTGSPRGCSCRPPGPAKPQTGRSRACGSRPPRARLRSARSRAATSRRSSSANG